MLAFHSSSVVLSSTPPNTIPAMLHRMSRRPQRSQTACTIRAQSLSTDTSALIGIAWPPASRMSLVVSSAAARSKSATPICAPSLANKIALAFPIPAPAPVITATLFVTCMSSHKNSLPLSMAHRAVVDMDFSSAEPLASLGVQRNDGSLTAGHIHGLSDATPHYAPLPRNPSER